MSGLSLFRNPPLQVAVEIGSRHVVAVSLTGRRGTLRVAGFAIEPLPEGTVAPSLTATNIAKPAVLTEAVAKAFTRLGSRPRRIGLVVPDTVAKVSLVRFAHVPARASDLDELVRFQVRKAAPFKPEEAQISYSPGASGDGGHEYVVVQARRDIIQEYEAVCAEAGASAGLVDLASFSVINAAVASSSGSRRDWLLVHVTPDFAAIAILRDAQLIFFRTRSADGEGQLSDLVHQTAMYYQDRLGGSGFEHVLLAGSNGGSGESDLRRSIEGRLGLRVEDVNPTSIAPLAERLGPGRDLIHALTPAIGLVVGQHLEQ